MLFSSLHYLKLLSDPSNVYSQNFILSSELCILSSFPLILTIERKTNYTDICDGPEFIPQKGSIFITSPLQRPHTSASVCASLKEDAGNHEVNLDRAAALFQF